MVKNKVIMSLSDNIRLGFENTSLLVRKIKIKETNKRCARAFW